MYLIEKDHPLLCCQLRGRGYRPWVLEHCLLASVMWYPRSTAAFPQCCACLHLCPSSVVECMLSQELVGSIIFLTSSIVVLLRATQL